MTTFFQSPCRWIVALGFACGVGAPSAAWAQYKNLSLAADLGYDAIRRPTIYSGPNDTDVIGQSNRFPLRLSEGLRLGAETNMKMHSDHWWLHFRVNVHMLYITTRGDPVGKNNLRTYDENARQGIGTVLGLEPEVGLRYYFLTDRVRPYIQPALTYMRLFTFTNAQGCDADSDATFCDSSNSLSYSYLPHQNILALQLQPGVEFVVKRDLAITLSLTYSHWFLFNAADSDAFTPAIGLTIYG